LLAKTATVIAAAIRLLPAAARLLPAAARTLAAPVVPGGRARPRAPETGRRRRSQVTALEAAGCKRIFSEKISTRIKIRPELEATLQLARGPGRRTYRRFTLTLKSPFVTACGFAISNPLPSAWRLCRQAELLERSGLSGGARDIRSDDVRCVPVQAAAGPTWCRTASWFAGQHETRPLAVAQRDPGIETGRERFTNPAGYLSATSGRSSILPRRCAFRCICRIMRVAGCNGTGFNIRSFDATR
jgi:hypothetical protein